MTENMGNSKHCWDQGLSNQPAKTTTDGHMTQTTGKDTTRPSTDSDIGKLFNRMNPPGVMGQTNGHYGG